MSNQEYHSTTDTAEATYLLIQGFRLIEIEYTSERYTYYFRNDDGITDHVQKFLTGHAVVNPQQYHKVNRRLIDCIKHKRQWGML